MNSDSVMHVFSKQTVIIDPTIIQSEPRIPGNVRVVCAHCEGVFQVVQQLCHLSSRLSHCHCLSVFVLFAQAYLFIYKSLTVICEKQLNDPSWIASHTMLISTQILN